MRRRLPDIDESLRILAARRTRPQRRPPPAAGRALTGLLKALDERFGQGPGALQARWREIVGEELAARTEPVKLVKSRLGGSTLELKVAGAAAALIQHQAPDILARVNLFLGAGTVERLRIVQGPVRPAPRAAAPGPSASAGPAGRVRRGPLDAAEEARLAEGLAAAPDGPLKSALLKLGREVLRRDGG